MVFFVWVFILYTNTIYKNVFTKMAEKIDQDEKNRIELRFCLDFLSEKIHKTSDNRVKEKLMKSYNILVSEKSPWIQKRQIMSQSCGDYRKKMAEDLKNHQKRSVPHHLEAI